ncbi:hypothetical protein [Nocardia sp. NPDC050435]|uniref:hypothetical protein n=1 Tax=Nocardia sp. NPDC050435 TaxID=3155040 RepID=UPI0033D1F630
MIVLLTVSAAAVCAAGCALAWSYRYPRRYRAALQQDWDLIRRLPPTRRAERHDVAASINARMGRLAEADRVAAAVRRAAAAGWLATAGVLFLTLVLR